VRVVPPADERSQLQLFEQAVTKRLPRAITGVVNVESLTLRSPRTATVKGTDKAVSSTPIPSLTLNDGRAIPQLGFGGDEIPPEQTEAAVTIALEAGYRHLDTAAAYRNEAETGAAIAASSLPREELFVTTKMSNDDQGRDRTRRAVESSLSKLGLDYLDLYLIHWPAPGRGLYEETWLTLIDLQREGLMRSIGVSNFEPQHLDRLAEVSDVVPAVNQIELQPFLQQERLRAYHRERGILTESWMHLAEAEIEILFPALVEIAQRHNVTATRVALAWSLQLGNVVLSRSVTPERIRGNLEAVSLRLSKAEMDAIAELERGERVGPDPSRFS
jgi:2,5-diketo-D-gluconate reductase A